MNKILIHLLLMFFFILLISCSSSLSNKNESNSKGIVRMNGKKDKLSFTDKFQRNSIKALPIIISTGYTTKDNKTFTEIEFRSYNKKASLDYDIIEMYNLKGDMWQWVVDKRNKEYFEKRFFTIETYRARVDSKIDELIRFFNYQPIYLKLKGNKNNFKPLEHSHVESILKVLKYASSLQ